MDEIKKMAAGHSIEVLDAIMTEVEEARGEYDNLGERLDEMSSDTPSPSTAAPAMDGTASPGTSEEYARADHVHPSDTSKQDALSATQLAAVNSGIDSAKVAQIELNKNNISLLADQSTLYNLSRFAGAVAESDEVTIASGIAINIPSGDYYVKFDTTATSGTVTIGIKDSNNSNVVVVAVGNTAKLKQFTVPNNSAVSFNVYVSKAGTYSNFQIIPKSLYDAGFTDYQPYALSNVELTAKEQVNENNISNLQNQFAVETKQVNLNDLTWTVSTGGNGIYYSSIVSLSTVDRVYGSTLIDFGAIEPTNIIYFIQTASARMGFRLLCNTNTFLNPTSYVTFRIFGSKQST